jgi:hypothetical protein
MNEPSDPDDDESNDRRSVGLIGLVVVLVLGILAVVLIRELGRQSKVQDCLMAGRTNCALIEPSPRQ